MPPAPPPPAPDAAPAARLRLRLLLVFTPAEFERRFVEHYVAFYYRYAQASLALGLLLILGDYLVDRIANPGVASNLLRVTAAAPLLALGLGYTFLAQARRHWQPALAALIVAVGLCLFWILLRMDIEGGPGLRSWVGVLNFTFLEFYCFVILGIQFRIALIAGTLILAGFVGAMWWHPSTDASDVVYWSYHVLTLFILAAGIGWWREYVLRSEFKTRAELDHSREAAERLARIKSEFLASMSHEIRTPLNGVLGMTELLIGSGLPQPQRAWAETVRASGRHLLSVINDVLDVSKIESGRLTLESTAFDLRDLIEQSVAMFLQPAQAKGLRLAWRLTPPTARPMLTGDPLRLRQVVANLVSNAVKFTEHGHIDVDADVQIAEGAVACVRISVADTGIGIPPEAHHHIFEQFSQADSSTTRRYGGTGLGLAICRQLITLMGGRITLDSQLGKGSRFVVELHLPVAAPLGQAPYSPGADPHAADEPALARLRGKVLLVDDNPINLAVSSAMLHKLGLDCDVADNGAVAVEKVSKARYDLVLMDCQMPVMDGYSAATAIRQLSHGRGAHLPIIAVTAHSGPGELARCLAAGMSAHLVKPFSLAALHGQLVRWLPGHAESAQPQS